MTFIVILCIRIQYLYKELFMNSIMSKKEILNRILEEQKKVIDNLQTSIDRYKSASSRDDDNSIDPEDYSHQDEAKDMKMRLEEILHKEQRDKTIIENCLNSQNSVIERGAVIETQEYYFFVGVSLPKFTWNGKDVLTISEKAPIFSKIKDKKAGDEITLGNKSLRILAIS